MIKNREVIATQNSPTKSQPFYNKPPLYMVPSNPQSVDSPASHLFSRYSMPFLGSFCIIMPDIVRQPNLFPPSQAFLTSLSVLSSSSY